MLAADLGNREATDRLSELGAGADILVNNAAVCQRFLPSTDWPEAYWREVFEVGFWAPSLLIRNVGNRMAERGRGVILTISSSAALKARPFLGHYSAMKAAMDMVTRVTAMELGAHGVRAVSIAPGAIETGHHGLTDPRAMATPLGRVGQPGDIAELAAFLVSDDAAFISGAVTPCDGGVNAGEFSRYEAYASAVEHGSAS